LSFDLSC